MRLLRYLMVIFAALTIVGCTQEGTEIGTPEPIKDVTVQLTADDGQRFILISDGAGNVTIQQLDETGAVIDSVTQAVKVGDDQTADINVTFSDGTNLGMIVYVSKTGNIESISMTVNGVDVAVDVVEENQEEEEEEGEEKSVEEEKKTDTEDAPKTIFVDVAAGKYHTCAVDTDGYAWCWGDGKDGKLGYSTQTITNTKPQKVDSINAASKVAVSSHNSCIIDKQNNTYCWGKGFDKPKRLDGNNKYVDISLSYKEDLGYTLICGRKADNDLRCDSLSGESASMVMGGVLGQSVTDSHIFIVKEDKSVIFLAEEGLPDIFSEIDNAANIYAVGSKVYVLTDSGSLIAADAADMSVSNFSDIDNIISISAGEAGVCAIDSEFKLFCGSGKIILAQIEGLPSVEKVSVGASHKCIVQADGRVKCWGENSHGQIGNSTTESQSEPTPIDVE